MGSNIFKTFPLLSGRNFNQYALLYFTVTCIIYKHLDTWTSREQQRALQMFVIVTFTLRLTQKRLFRKNYIHPLLELGSKLLLLYDCM